MIYCKTISQYFCLCTLVLLLASCDKVDITFAPTSSEDDPNITFFDNYETAIATYKPDSFLTSSHQVISLGYHRDAVFGVVKAGSFVQVNLPATNPVANKTVVFDSLELLIKPSGEFYGDSTKPIKVNVYRLTQNIKDAVNGDYYYNTSSFAYDPVNIGEQTVNLNSKSGTTVRIRLSDILGQELLTKFKSSDDAVSSTEKFADYFKGIYINTDSTVTSLLAYFSAPADSPFIRLTYHEAGLFPEKKQLDFTFTTAKQFNNISFRHTAPNFAAFINNKKQLIESAASGNQSYLNTNLAAAIKISFSNLLNLKELHPYIKVVRAVLVIKPDTSPYTFPYQLPKTLNLYSTDENNNINAGIYDNNTTSPALQTGSLTIDYLYGIDTYYSFDITSFINTKIEEGQFSKSALMLYPSASNIDGALQRLIVNNKSNSKSVQLKLYVLGL
ncbi:DUF4270 family protein [Ferruginibacter sp.]|nr:DUF4270 family protein [Ferruginibacter sp.]